MPSLSEPPNFSSAPSPLEAAALETRLREAEDRLREAVEELELRQRRTRHLHPPCDHAVDSCIANAIGNLCQSFLLSYGVRVGIGILLRAFKLARGQSYSSLLDLKQLVSEKDLIVREEACRIGLLFGGFTGSYHALRCLLRKLRKKETPLNVILAGSVAGLSILALDDSNRRRTLALYLLARLGQCAYNSEKFKKKFHLWRSHLRHGDSLLFSLACAQVMYAFVMRPESLPKSYRDFIQKTGPVAAPIYKAVRDCCRGSPVDIASLSFYLSNRRVSTSVKLEEFPSIIPCPMIHPDTNSCLAHNVYATSATFRKTFPLYFSLTFVPFVVLRLQKFMGSPLQTCWHAVTGAVRSTSFLSAFVGAFQGVICLHRKVASNISDADFADCVEIQPELKKLKLRKNNWSSEAYRFDEVFTGSASQKRVYEVVAKPVVESVLDGYNGTVMAYGQTGTGKTYTLGRLGEDDASERGIMVRALEDIIANTSTTSDNVEISYLQLYMESVQDLLAPEKINIPIVEDPKTGEVSAPGASVVGIQNLEQFLQVLKVGETNRHAANTKLNTESSRSHAILMIYVRRSVQGNEENDISILRKNSRSDLSSSHGIPTVRKSKLLIVDLAGSERLDKSGSEGHTAEETKFINLSLTSLGKCINALAENSPHIPTRDSKLTRMLRDSFGGTARTSLIITIGPSSRHHAETTSTIMFGQRAMKVVNVVKLKEEFDYESLCRKLENQVDDLTAEIDRQLKLRDNDKTEIERKLEECKNSFAEAKKSLVARTKLLEEENTRLESEMIDILKELNHQKDHNDLMRNEVARLETNLKNSKLIEKDNARLEAQMKDILKELNLQKDHSNSMHDEIARLEMSLSHSRKHQLEDSTNQKVLAETTQMYEKKIAELMKQLKDEHSLSKSAEEQSDVMKKTIAELMMQLEDKHTQFESSEKQLDLMKKKISELMLELEDERDRSKSAEEEVDVMKKLLSDYQKTAQMEHTTYQKALADSTQMYEEKIVKLIQQLEDEQARSEGAKEQLVLSKKLLSDHQNLVQIQEQQEIDNLRMKLEEMSQLHDVTVNELQSLKSEYRDLLSEKSLKLQIQDQNDIDNLRMKLQEMSQLHDATVNELQSMKSKYRDLLSEKAIVNGEFHAMKQSLVAEERRRKTIEYELVSIKKVVPESEDEFEDKKSFMKENIAKGSSTFGTHLALQKSNNVSRETVSGQRTTIAKICEEVGLQKILSLLTSGDIDVQIHAVKVIANLAAEDVNQEKIVEEGGLDALLMLLRSSQNTTILRVASGAVANLAMNERNQGLITSEGGARLLANTASRTDDPQTLRMVAGAIANLCGNERLHVMLREEGGIKALFGMVRSGNSDIIAQVARGIANFAKCESRGIIQGHRRGHSLLIEDGVLTWLIANSNIASTSTRRHIELALCHLAQNVDNSKDFVSSGGLKELLRISTESSREDIRNLAKKTLKNNPLFQAQMQSE